MSLLRATRRLFARPDAPAPEVSPEGRRSFFRTAAGMGAGMALGGLMLPDEAWAGVEERAARFGITPGTLVDAQGRPMASNPMIDTPYIGLICMFGFNFPPRGWALCNGQLLSIAQNTALFSLLGTFYGGNGQTTFGLPDFRGRFPMNWGQGPGLSNRVIGEQDGVEAVTLQANQMPAHTHALQVTSNPGTTDDPSGRVLARPASSIPQYAATPTDNMAATSIGLAGGSLPHNNMPPFLAVTFAIALQGIYPARD